MTRKQVSVTILEKDWETPDEGANDWYYRHLLGGCTSPTAGYVAGANNMEKKALRAFCMLCTKCGTCKKVCEKAHTFRELLYKKL